MKRVWTAEQLAANWLLFPSELEIVQNKQGVSRLGFAVLLKFFQFEGRFPTGPHEIPGKVLRFIAPQVEAQPDAFKEYPWQGRTVERHRATIRNILGFRESTVGDARALEVWLIEEVLNREHRMDQLREIILERCRALRIEPPAPEQLRRLVNSALHSHETRFCQDIFQKLHAATMDHWILALHPTDEEEGWTLWQSPRGTR
jgi:hypothetical protein